MIPFESAVELVLKHTDKLNVVKMPILGALNSICAVNIISPTDIPIFTNSAMDGYAVHRKDIKDLPATMPVFSLIKAGDYLKKKVLKCHVVKIMTGAPLPAYTDTVVPVEFTELLEDNKVLIKKIGDKGHHVRLAGEDFKKGEVIIKKGTLLKAAEIGLLATIGITHIEIYRHPQIAIISTGNELVEINEPLKPGKIRNSNSYLLAAAVMTYGGIPLMQGIAGDTEEAIMTAIVNSESADIIITTGGVSMGDYDLVLSSLQKLGFEQIFYKVAMKPGKPTLFGRLGTKLFFGLPGNPASSLMTFEEFVHPAIRKMRGFEKFTRPIKKAILTTKCKSDKERIHFLRAFTELKDNKYYTTPLKSQGAADLLVFSQANSIIISREEKQAGEEVEVQLLSSLLYLW